MAIRRTHEELAVGTAPQETTLTGVRANYNEDGTLKNYWIENSRFQDFYIHYNHKNPEYNFAIFDLASQILGQNAEYDDEKLHEAFTPYIGKTFKVCIKPAVDFDRGNVCFNPNYKPAEQQAVANGSVPF